MSRSSATQQTGAGPDRTPRDRPSLTVDVVAIARQQGRPLVLLIRRRKPPYQDRWALPGGFVEPQEPLEAAARRELREETGIVPQRLEQLHAFGDPGRDPRGWTVSIAYLALVTGEDTADQSARAGSDAIEARWFDLDDVPALAFDHAEILAFAVRRLGWRGKGPRGAAGAGD